MGGVPPSWTLAPPPPARRSEAKPGGGGVGVGGAALVNRSLGTCEFDATPLL